MRKTMILDGSSKVNSGKVYETARELQLSKDLEQLKNQLKEAVKDIKFLIDKMPCFYEDESMYLDAVKNIDSKYMNKSGEK